MKITTIIMLLSLSAMAETSTVQISGMKCGACVESIQAKLCKMDGLTKCDVSVGQAVLETAQGTKLNEKTVADLISKSGHFKMEKITTSK